MPKPSKVTTPRGYPQYAASEIEAVSIASAEDLPSAVAGFRKHLNDEKVQVLELVRFHSRWFHDSDHA